MAFYRLADKLENWKQKSSGTWGIWIEDLDTGEKWTWNEHLPFVAASIIKVPIMTAVYRAAAQGVLQPSDRLCLKSEDQVGGTGILQHLSPGTELSVQDLITMMIIQSDNTATNMLIDLIGKEEINETIQELEMKNTRFYNRLMIVPVKTDGINQTTAADMARCFQKLARGQVISRHTSAKMIEILKKQQLRDCLPSLLPPSDSEFIGTLPKWQMAHKTGMVSKILHDTGILYIGSRSLIVICLSTGLSYHRARKTCNKIGKWIYDAYTE